MIRVLQVIGAMDRAGAEMLLMNLFRNIDRSKVQFDFLVHTSAKCDFDDEIESLGGNIYRVPRYKIANRHAYRNSIRTFFQEHPEHAIVHGHIGSSAPIYLSEATRSNRYTIAHSHVDTNPFDLHDIVFRMISRPVRGKADFYMACSDGAGLDRFGERIVNSDVFAILNNGIMVDNFTRDAEDIRAAKKSFGFKNEPIFGHVGRLTTQKNQLFLLDVFNEVKKKLPDARLMLVGKGEDEEKLRKKAERLKIADSVLFLGIIEDVARALRAMDVFVFPSISEGLSVSLVEVQAVGIQCITSEIISDSGVFTNRIRKLPLGNASKWAKECIAAYERSKELKDSQEDQVIAAGFDIADTAKWLQDFYIEHAQ